MSTCESGESASPRTEGVGSSYAPHPGNLADQAASVLEVVQKLAEEYALKANCSVGLELPREANELWHIEGRKQIYDRVG
jgi:hypothetical protein